MVNSSDTKHLKYTTRKILLFPKIGGKPPKWMVKIMENPINPWMIGGEKPQFLETPKRGSQGEKKVPRGGSFCHLRLRNLNDAFLATRPGS